MWMIGEIIVEKRAARVTVVVRCGNEDRGSGIRHTKDDEVVHYTTEKAYEPHYAYSNGRKMHELHEKRFNEWGGQRFAAYTPDLEDEKNKHDRLPKRVQLVNRRRGIMASDVTSSETSDIPRPPSQSRSARSPHWQACGGIWSGIVGLKKVSIERANPICKHVPSGGRLIATCTNQVSRVYISPENSVPGLRRS